MKFQHQKLGTRHRTAERTAKQTGELVISISQRRNTITVFKGNDRYVLEDTEVVLNFDDNDQLVSMKAIGSMEADSEEQAEQLESMFSSDEDALKDMIGVSEGMSMDLKVKGKTVTFTINADVEQLVDVGLIGADDASEMTKDELISYFEDQDMTCK